MDLEQQLHQQDDENTKPNIKESSSKELGAELDLEKGKEKEKEKESMMKTKTKSNFLTEMIKKEDSKDNSNSNSNSNSQETETEPSTSVEERYINDKPKVGVMKSSESKLSELERAKVQQKRSLKVRTEKEPVHGVNSLDGGKKHRFFFEFPRTPMTRTPNSRTPPVKDQDLLESRDTIEMAKPATSPQEPEIPVSYFSFSYFLISIISRKKRKIFEILILHFFINYLGKSVCSIFWSL